MRRVRTRDIAALACAASLLTLSACGGDAAAEGDGEVLRVAATPTPHSDILRWVDEAAAVCAARWTGHESVVAVFGGGVRFVRNIHVGDLVRVEALLVNTTERSMHVALRVYASRRTGAESRLVAHSIAVMVDVSAEDQAQRVRQYVPESESARRLQETAIELVRMRSEVSAAWTEMRRSTDPR